VTPTHTGVSQHAAHDQHNHQHQHPQQHDRRPLRRSQRDRVSFEDDRGAYKALTLLGELDSQHRAGVREAVVAERGEDGRLIAKDQTDSSSALVGTASGG
jgi:hypothetical protein